MECTSDLDPTRELLWWNATCGPNFDILPSNWSAQVIIQDSSHISPPAIWPDCMQSDTTCNSTLAKVWDENLSERCIVDANGYCSTAAESFEMDDFCNTVNFENACLGTCQEGLDHTRALLWWDYVCGTQDLPTSWRDSLYIANSSFLSNATSNFTWPRCLHNSTAANDSLSASAIQCSSDRCILDENGLCTNNANFTNQKCFCGPLKYQAVCPDFDTAACTSISERQDYLLWLNSTCSSDTEWHGLPNQWLDGLKPLVDDMIPWHWRLEPNRCLPNVNYTEQCPSNAAKLVIFAAVNAAMLLATLIFGRRTIINKLTFGCLGAAHSKWWFVSAIIVVALQLVSNMLNALLIRRMPGYSHISIGGLTLLWCTRPRVSWLAVLLITVSAEEAMYFSTAASSLLAEIVLQMLGSYYMGVVANYGTKNNFYRGSLHKAQRMKYAQMMYAGSLLWLLVITIAVWALAWSALHVNKVIAEVGSEVVQVKLRNITKKRTADHFAKEARNCKRNALVREHNINERVRAMEMSDISSRSINSQSSAGYNLMNAVERAEHSSWSRLSRSCITLASSWARVEQEILQVLEEEKRQVGVRQEQLGVKDVFSVQKKIIALDQRIRGLDSNDTNAAKIQICRNEGRVSRQKLSSYAERRERELHTCLQTAQDQQISGRRNCEDARPDRTAVNADLSPEFDKTWAAIQEDWSKVEEAWRRIANSWEDELDILERVKRTSSGKEESRYILKTLSEGKTRKKMRTILIVVCMGMLLCWIAQWLFWAGFVNLILDGYCPPSLGSMVGIWIGFSVTGEAENYNLIVNNFRRLLMIVTRSWRWSKSLMISYRRRRQQNIRQESFNVNVEASDPFDVD